MSLALPGYVYYDNDFVFSDGTKGKKLFVVLGDSRLDKDFVLVARTTSKAKTKCDLGCYCNQYPPCFCIPCQESCFNLDTWIMLDDIAEYDSDTLSSWLRKGTLSIELTKSVILCAIQSEHIARWVRESLEITLETLS